MWEVIVCFHVSVHYYKKIINYKIKTNSNQNNSGRKKKLKLEHVDHENKKADMLKLLQSHWHSGIGEKV